MSSETDQPRQRTVAELLAEHGDSAAAGRRRRRRESDEPDAGSAADGAMPPEQRRRGQPPVPDRGVLREPVPPPPWRVGSPPADPTPSELGGRRRADGPPAGPVRENPTDVMPRIVDDLRPPGDATGPIPQGSAPAASRSVPVADPHDTVGGPRGYPDDALDGGGLDPDGGGLDPNGGPPTVVGAAPIGATGSHRRGTAGPAASDGGPPTQAAPPEFDDRPDGPKADAAEYRDDGYDEYETAAADVDDDEYTEEYAEDDTEGPAEDETDDADAVPVVRRGRAKSSSPGRAWAAVVAQWLVGAIGGAALWVGFRFLWRNLPVVALAAAVLVTVGLVVIVRALLRNNDTRTTVFAVLVGLLLTVSPAILVLLGR